MSAGSGIVLVAGPKVRRATTRVNGGLRPFAVRSHAIAGQANRKPDSLASATSQQTSGGQTPSGCDQVETMWIELGVETLSNVILVLSESAMVVLPPATVAAASAFAPAALP